jgi:hypothetical protein
MNWISPEVKEYYTMFNKVYTSIMLKYHPYLSLIYVDPYTFNLALTDIETKTFPSANVIICTSFTEKLNESERDLGTDVTRIFIDIQKLVPKNEVLKNIKLYPDAFFNKTKYCKGIVKYHFK